MIEKSVITLVNKKNMTVLTEMQQNGAFGLLLGDA